jgi:3-deoxy-7-phosphoheptulonate synthase
LVEVHPNPLEARSDGEQSLSLEAFADLMTALRPFAAAADRSLTVPATAGVKESVA